MKMFGSRTASLMAAAVVASCSSSGGQRTIEPGASNAIEPTNDVDDSEFVLSREPKRPDTAGEFPIHIEEKWWPFRARYLELSVRKVRRRDARISMTRPPASFWDEQTAVEAVSVWTSVCNECHGGRRRLKDALDMSPPPEDWGRGNGLFFGRSRPYREIFGTIWNGGPPSDDGEPSEMPVWKDKLPRELIWAMIWFLEVQSGGREGRFPPSLYPRQSDP